MASVSPNPDGVIESFDYAGVELGASRLRDQYQATRDYFLAVPDDDILKGFRLRAGLPAPGDELGGWYSGDDRGMWYSEGGFGSTFGQWLSAFARIGRATGDSAMRAKALTLLHEWARTLAPDGYFGAQSHSGRTGIGHYTFDKMCGGLVDVAHYLGESEALRHLETITSWARGALTTRRLPASIKQPFGWEPGVPRESEWYTLSENLYRAYLLTGDPGYRDYARVWHYATFWADLADGRDAFPGKHAYSHCNTLSGAALAYAVTGDEQYLRTITNAYDILWRNHLYASGGYGPEELFWAPEALSWTLMAPYGWLTYPASFETACGSWAAFKLCRYLLQLTGSARYGDWIERLIYNGVGAALPMAGRGDTFYYSDYRTRGGSKTHIPEPWPCCSGTFPQAVADYHNLIYFRDAAGLYVNLFVPSRVTWPVGGCVVTVQQETSFPESPEVRLTVRAERPSDFALRFRVPGWTDGAPAARVNGLAQPLATAPGSWAEVRRVWRDGDTLEVDLPLRLRFAPLHAIEHPARGAFMAGPVVLACDRGSAQPVLSGDPTDPESWIRPIDAPLEFALDGDAGKGIFRPFYRYGAGERYWMYFDVVAT